MSAVGLWRSFLWNHAGCPLAAPSCSTRHSFLNGSSIDPMV